MNIQTTESGHNLLRVSASHESSREIPTGIYVTECDMSSAPATPSLWGGTFKGTFEHQVAEEPGAMRIDVETKTMLVSDGDQWCDLTNADEELAMNIARLSGVINASIGSYLREPTFGTSAKEMFSWFDLPSIEFTSEKLEAMGISPKFLESYCYDPLSPERIAEELEEMYDDIVQCEMDEVVASALDAVCEARMPEARMTPIEPRGMRPTFAILDEFAFWPGNHTQKQTPLSVDEGISRAIESTVEAEDELLLDAARKFISSRDGGLTWLPVTFTEAASANMRTGLDNWIDSIRSSEVNGGTLSFNITYMPATPAEHVEFSCVTTPYKVQCDEHNNPPDPVRTRPSVKERFLALKYGKKL